MQIGRTKFLAVLSEALDSVEKEILGATSHHAKRVSWLCLRMADTLGMPSDEKAELATAALLHDSALNEYRKEYENGAPRTDVSGKAHCAAGEENLRMIPGFSTSRNFIRYHHERADGKGPFGKREHDTPLGAQLIHIADETDRKMPLGNIAPADLPALKKYIQQQQGILFGAPICEAMLFVLSDDPNAMLHTLSDKSIAQWMPDTANTAHGTDIRSASMLFARIIDYKSPFTKNHSVGLAEKAEAMSRHYGWDEKTSQALYCAGALHDIGKLMVDRDVLEKPGKLDKEEYQHIQTHAYETYRLLSKLDGLGKIRDWASFHHEKLNGKGYPFGKSADTMDEKARLLACLDIYQALTEDRPYKAGMGHGKAMSILRELVQKGELDAKITEDIGQVFYREENTQQQENTALFQCPVCGHIYEGAVVPQGYLCPVCGQPETAFLRIK